MAPLFVFVFPLQGAAFAPYSPWIDQIVYLSVHIGYPGNLFWKACISVRTP